MTIFLCILGFAIVVYAQVDVLWTTFLEGGAPLTSRVCAGLARGVLALQCWIDRRGASGAKSSVSLHAFNRGTTSGARRRRRLIASAGLVVVFATVACWGLMIWVGWALVFLSRSDALVGSDSHDVPDLITRVYFVGSTIFTLGMGDYRPQGHFFQLVSAVAAGSGFILFGLALAYLVPVTSAATQKRQLAVCIWALGKSPDDIIIRAWNGVDSAALAPHLISLIPMLALLGENHLTYPVLHYFHSTKRSSSVAASVAALDESITILECGMQSGCSLDLPSLGAAREAITEYLNTLRPALIFPARDTPPPPSLQALRDIGVPAVDDSLFEAALASMSERRRLLLALVRNEGWTWDAVWPPAVDPTPVFSTTIRENAT
jgi:hypothetical protein